MADIVSADVRSRMMRNVRAKNTACELQLRSLLWKSGVRGWRLHGKHLPGSPDLYFPRWQVAVFVDGAFWHGHPSRHRVGRSGSWWDDKIASNVARDARVNARLADLGWTVIRIWDFEVLRESRQCVHQVRAALASRGRGKLPDRLNLPPRVQT